VWQICYMVDSIWLCADEAYGARVALVAKHAL
jgi:hypothetical protein